jgi:iron complex outermembrane receptor protein
LIAATRPRFHTAALRVALLSLALALALPTQAQVSDPAATLDTIRVLGPARPLSTFPGAVSVIDSDALHTGQRQVSLAEPLARVPGVSVLDRQNLAQDLQIQSRGFGARSTFGVRGIRLVVDGIPASAADGQGQAANFPLGSLDRIEVLRGPLALQYGNAAGGVIVGHTDLAEGRGQRLEAWADDDGGRRIAGRLDGENGDTRWRVGASDFRTDGVRPHSAARRSQFDAVAEWNPHEGERLRLVLNSLTQPDTDDPLGLTREAWQQDPHGTDPAALRFDTRKRIGNHQLGLRWERDYRPGRGIWLGGHAIDRDVLQYLSIPEGAQQAPGSGGGVIDLGRRSYGVDAGHRWDFPRGSVATGVELARLDEARRGYENFVVDAAGDVVRGVRGRLRRDESNRVSTREVHAIADYRLTEAWTLLGAVRRTRLDFTSDDHYIAPGNGDDSGRLDYDETSASLGIARAYAWGEAFASLGRGFETPTVTELAYRPDGTTGFNRELSPARFDSVEVGTRWRFDDVEASLALYRVEGEDEIVPAQSQGGRTSYANAGRTRRTGLELSVAGGIGAQWSYLVAASWIDARFTQEFSYRVNREGQSVQRTVQSDNRIPGIPRADGFAELAWHSADRRISAAAEAQLGAAIAVDDLNSDSAPGHARLALRMDWRLADAGGWYGFARVDNLFDRAYIGSVIVNDGNGRHFEPGPGRTFTLGLGWRATR